MRWTRAVLTVLLLVPLVAADAFGQRWREPKVTLEVYGGLADYGQFLEQALLVDFMEVDDVVMFDERFERELTADAGFTLGGSVGVWPWDETGFRGAFTWSPTDLKFEDDSGFDRETFDLDDVADLSSYTFSLEVVKLLLDPGENRFNAYATAGIVGTWWSLGDDDRSGEIVTPDDTQFRWGGVGGIGVLYRLAENWEARLEATTFGLGSPFDGDNAYLVTSDEWFTFDEHNNVRLTRYTLGVAYHFLRD